MTLTRPPIEQRFSQYAALTLSLLLILSACRDAPACSCQSPDRASAFNNADEVVGGEITGTQRNETHKFRVFQVGKR